MSTLPWTKQARIYNIFNNWWWENWTVTYRRMKSEYFLTPYTKINSKWIKDKCKARNLKNWKKRDRTPFDINCSKIFFDSLPRIMKIKTKINKWDLIKSKAFL